MFTTQPASALLQALGDVRRRGQRVILLNLGEQSFRSCFNYYTNLHHRLFVALALDQTLLACPNASLLLYSRDGNDASDFAADEVFQSCAINWLHEHGHFGFCCASSLTVSEVQLQHLLGSLDLANTSDSQLICVLFSAARR